MSMKQRITIEQLEELNDQQKKQLRDWWMGSSPRLSDLYVVLVKYDDVTRYEGPYVNSGHRDFLEDFHTGEALPLLSIGQIIDLLNDGNKRVSICTHDGQWEVVAHSKYAAIEPELCDALWDVAKRLL